MAASRAESGGYLQVGRLEKSELAGCAAAVFLVITLFLPWYSTSSDNPNSMLSLVGGGTATGGDTVSAFQVLPIWRWLLLAAAIAPFILAWIVARGHKLDWRPGEITMVVGVAAFVVILSKGIILGAPGDSVEIGLQWGYPLALLACVAMAVAGYRRQARSITHRKPPGTL